MDGLFLSVSSSLDTVSACSWAANIQQVQVTGGDPHTPMGWNWKFQLNAVKLTRKRCTALNRGVQDTPATCISFFCVLALQELELEIILSNKKKFLHFTVRSKN